MSRRKREREAPEVGAMAGRVIRALVRRASEGDGEALEQLLSLEAQISSAIKDAGAGMHRFGYSFTELGTIAGISRQAARERFGTPNAIIDEAIDEAIGETTVDAGDRQATALGVTA